MGQEEKRILLFNSKILKEKDWSKELDWSLETTNVCPYVCMYVCM